MLCISIIGPFLGDIEQQLSRAVGFAEIVEMRLDLFQDIELNDLRMLKERFVIPMLFTLRSVVQGGGFQGSISDRCHLLRKFASLQPALLDVESDTPYDEIVKLKQLAPHVRLLASHHDPQETPLNLEAALEKLQRLPTDQYKLATRAHSAEDALRIMALTQKFNRQGGCLTGICMGNEGVITRILASQIGSPLIFACLEEALASAPGQVPWRDLLEIYRLRERSPSAQRLGLIGDPIDKSPGHIAHNAIFHQLGLDAIYTKLRVEPGDLSTVMQALRTIGWHGLAVTMPLKEKILPLLDSLDASASAMGAVNTIVTRNGTWRGYNTDGDGALDAIEIATGPVTGKKALVLGAGGAAKAVAWAAKQRGARVTLVNRTNERARQAASHLECDFIPWSQLQNAVAQTDLLLQATSLGIAPAVEEPPVNAAWISPETIVFDVISRPSETRLLREAKARGCKVVPGTEMFIYQAVRQIAIWFGADKLTPDLADQYRCAIAQLPAMRVKP